MKSIVRKDKSTLENKKDFYQTHPYMVKALIKWFKENNFSKDLKVLDPCCGKYVITNGLQEYFNDVTYYDKYAGDINKDFLDEEQNFDIIIMNPPFSDKYNFIDRARNVATHVFCLLPLNCSNFNIVSRDYEDIHEFVGKIQMAPKMFLDETTDWRPGGNSQYCWYYWKKGENSNFSKTWYDDLLKYKKAEER